MHIYIGRGRKLKQVVGSGLTFLLGNKEQYERGR